MQTSIEEDIKTIDSFLLSLGSKCNIDIYSFEVVCSDIIFHTKGDSETIRFSMNQKHVNIKSFCFTFDNGVFLALDRIASYMEGNPFKIKEIEKKWRIK